MTTHTENKPAAIRLMTHYVTDGTHKAVVSYGHVMSPDGRECVTIYPSDQGYLLDEFFGGGGLNGIVISTDYFDRRKVQVHIFPDSPLYAAALARCAR